MIDPRTLLLFYRRHLRVQPLRELMAVMGVAAGVALLFVVQVTNSSVTGAFEEVLHGVAGRASIEVAARSPEGFDQGTGEQIEQTPGVRRAAPVLAQQAIVAGRKSSRALTLVGADERLADLGGSLIQHFQRYAEESQHGLLLLAEPTARAIGARPGQAVAIKVAALVHHLDLGAIVPSSDLGPLSESPIAATSLPVMQVLAGLTRRVSRVLVEPAAGHEQAVRKALQRRFGSTLNVRPVDTESRLLADAAKPEGQLTAVFSAISLVVGVILAYNALLLASGERRTFVAYLVQLGTQDAAIVASLAFDALVLGVAGSLLGLLAGDVISLLAYRAPPGYLTAAFPIGGQRVLTWQTVSIAFAAGVLAAFAAAALPAITLLRSSATDPHTAGRALSLLRKPRLSNKLTFAAGALLIGTAIVSSIAWNAIAVVGLVTLAIGVVLCLPLTVGYTLKLIRAASSHSSDPSMRLASGELQTSPTRSIALVATGAIAVFLMVTIGGAVADVQRAVRAGAQQTGSNVDIWVRPGGAENIYDTQPFAYLDAQRALRRLAEIRTVQVYRQSFLDLPDRRLWVIGVPRQAQNPIAKSQIVNGSPSLATQRIRQGGWAAISQTVAIQRHLHIGQTFTLPTPSGLSSFKLAATISNYGWLPGTMLLNADDYGRLWRTTRASQLAITLKPGVSPELGKQAVQRALPASTALVAQTAEEREMQVSSVLGSTLSRLNQTTAVVLIAAIATVVAMMISAVWQRRGRLDALISIGMSFGQLARLVFYESGCVLLSGCLIGVASGVLGQYLIDTWLRHGTGSPIVFAAAWALGLRTMAIALGISVVAMTIAVLRTVGFQSRAVISTD